MWHSTDIRDIAKRVRLIFYTPPINETDPKMETRVEETDTYLSGSISPQGNTGFIHIETTEESQEHHQSWSTTTSFGGFNLICRCSATAYMLWCRPCSIEYYYSRHDCNPWQYMCAHWSIGVDWIVIVMLEHFLYFVSLSEERSGNHERYFACSPVVTRHRHTNRSKQRISFFYALHIYDVFQL